MRETNRFRIVCALVVIVAVFAAEATAQPPVKAQKSFAECVTDPKPYLAMDWRNFDQGFSPDGKEWGWREVSNKPECETAAADLIAMWMKQHAATLDGGTRLFMAFHEGQVRAMGGDYVKGAKLIEAGRADWDKKPEGRAYVDAILAFLRGDKPELMAARKRMMSVPEPPDFARTQKAYREQAGWEPKWPMNIEAVDKMIDCWGKGYTGGSRGDCEWTPAKRGT
jgi:hypothetical protein